MQRQRACRRISLVFFRSPFPFTASSSSLANKNDKAHEQPCSPTLIKRERDSAQPESAAQGREREREETNASARVRASPPPPPRTKRRASSPPRFLPFTHTNRAVREQQRPFAHTPTPSTHTQTTHTTNQRHPSRARVTRERALREEELQTHVSPACLRVACRAPADRSQHTGASARARASGAGAASVFARARTHARERNPNSLKKPTSLSRLLLSSSPWATPTWRTPSPTRQRRSSPRRRR